MNINSEAQASGAVESWRREPLSTQKKNIRRAIESLELGRIYYDQKGNKQGRARVERCLHILFQRKKELDTE